MWLKRIITYRKPIRNKNIHIKVEIEGEKLKQVDLYRYLAIILNDRGMQDDELDNRIYIAERTKMIK